MNQHDEHEHYWEHEKHSVEDDPFPGRQSKAEVGAMIIGNLVEKYIKTFSGAPKLLGQYSWEKIKKFKTNVMMLNQII